VSRSRPRPVNGARPASVIVCAGVLAGAAAGGGCVIDGAGRAPGRSPPAAPTATVPDAGSPLRHESAAETLDEAGPAPVPQDGGDVLDVAPGATPAPVR
jgi:hypothetical protein